MEVIMSLKFFECMKWLGYWYVKGFIKKKLKIIPRKCKRPFLEKRNCDFLNCRNMIVLIIFFIDFIIKL